MVTIVITVGVDGIIVKTRVKRNAQARSSPTNKMKNICLATQHDLFCVFVTATPECRLLGNYGTQATAWGPSKNDVYRGLG